MQVVKVPRLLQGTCKQLWAGRQHSLQPFAGWHADRHQHGKVAPRQPLRADNSSSRQMA